MLDLSVPLPLDRSSVTVTSCLGLLGGAFGRRSWQTEDMADKRLQEKIALIARLENWLAETVAYLEKNRDLYEKKKSRLNALVQQRKVMRVGSPSSDEEKLRKQCDQYEGQRASWFYVQEIEKQKSNLEAMKRRRRKKKEELSEKKIIKFATQLGYAVEPSKPKRTKKTVKKRTQKTVESDQTVVDMWRDKSEADVASARSKQTSAKRRLAGQLNSFNRCPYCATKLSFDQSHLDHIHPVSKGGLSEDDNLVLICAPCNTSKGAKTLRAFCRDAGLSYDLVIGRLEMIGKAV
mgnify:CR=1 FL=1